MSTKMIKVILVSMLLLTYATSVSASEPTEASKKEDDPPEPKPVILSRTELCEIRFEKEGLAEELWRCHEYDIITYLEEAGVPPSMKGDFLTVAACESAFHPDALGDGGWSKGLLQIRWDFWAEWADVNGYAWELGLTETPEEAYSYFSSTPELSKWDNPIINFELGRVINQYYDMPRHGRYWKQWAGRPSEDCEYKRDRLLTNLYGSTDPVNDVYGVIANSN